VCAFDVLRFETFVRGSITTASSGKLCRWHNNNIAVVIIITSGPGGSRRLHVGGSTVLLLLLLLLLLRHNNNNITIISNGNYTFLIRTRVVQYNQWPPPVAETYLRLSKLLRDSPTLSKRPLLPHRHVGVARLRTPCGSLITTQCRYVCGTTCPILIHKLLLLLLLLSIFTTTSNETPSSRSSRRGYNMVAPSASYAPTRPDVQIERFSRYRRLYYYYFVFDINFKARMHVLFSAL